MEKGRIGVFDSGLGGLWILKYLRKELPRYDYIFLADPVNAPYGDKSPDELFDIATKALDFLFREQKCSGVIIACNTISSSIYDRLREWKDKKYFGKILFGIVRPTVESLNNENPVAIFATPRTCKSEVYEKFLSSNVKNYTKIPMKDLASIIENGGDTHAYISLFKDKIPNNISRGALLCTHYGIVLNDFKKAFPSIKEWVSQEELIPKYLKDYFIEFPEREELFSRNSTVSIMVTRESEVFKTFKDRWFGESQKVELVDLNKNNETQ